MLFLNMFSGHWRKSRHNDGVQNTHTSPFLQRADRANQKVRVWLVGVLRMWWHGAEILAWCLTPALYRGTNGARVRRLMVDATWPLMTGYSVLTSLLSVVVIRIVLAAAADYGLSQYALNLLIRTLVLEVIPLLAATYVALRFSLVRRSSASTPEGAAATAVGAGFAVCFLAVTSAVLVSAIAYVSVFGLSPWGAPAFTTLTATIFTPVTTLVLILKTLFFAGAVAIVPLVSARRHLPERAVTRRFARLFAALLLVELLSLVGTYY